MMAPGARGVPAADQVLANSDVGFACLAPGLLSCSGCTADDNGTGIMSLVGAGTGDYVAETTYRYVGNGLGDLTFVNPLPQQTSNRGYIFAAVVGVLVVALVAVLFWPLPTSSTTKMLTILSNERKVCEIWGDPNVKTFDGARPSFYGAGEFWIIKNSKVRIQGRYQPSRSTDDGLASVTKLMIGGPFLEDHVIEIDPMLGGKGIIQIDNKQILKYINFQHDLSGKDGGLATIRYDTRVGDETRAGELIDPSQSGKPLNVLHMNLPAGLAVKVFRWENHLDIKVEMASLPDGQDGSCGNFNGDPADDTTSAVFERIGARIAPNDLLFSRRSQVTLSPQMDTMLNTQCSAERKQLAADRCRATLLDITEQRSCMFDWCFGMNEQALQVAKTLDR